MKLKNHRLQITFENPSSMTTPRFSHTGFITKVLLDGTYQFCMPEQLLPNRRNSRGHGLCGEFVLPTGELAKSGEWFFKPGVGLVRQTEDFQRFNIFGIYEVQPFPITVYQESDASICFFQKGLPRRGYCADIKKTYSLMENQLILDIEVTNTGNETLDLSEYQHNFISLEQKPVGPGYVLELPCDKNLSQLEDATLSWGDERHLDSAVYLKEHAVHWKDFMDEKVLYHESYDADPAVPASWTLRHENSSVAVTEEVDFTPSMIIVWSVEHCVCAELYYGAKITPGETARWRRTWTFNNYS